MRKHYQIICPEDGKQQVVEVSWVEQQPQIIWCSKRLGFPDCECACLKRIKALEDEDPEFEDPSQGDALP